MCGCLVYPLAYFLATVFLMMLTGLGPTPALIITAVLVLVGGILRLRFGLYGTPLYTVNTRNTHNAHRRHPRVNFRDIQANRRIARGQHSVFDHNRQNRMARRIWKK
jgi:hypothetical protein